MNSLIICWSCKFSGRSSNGPSFDYPSPWFLVVSSRVTMTWTSLTNLHSTWRRSVMPTKIVVVLLSTNFLFYFGMSTILLNSMLKSSFIHPHTVVSLKKNCFFFPFFAISTTFHFAPNSRFVEVALDSWSLSWCEIGGFSSSWFLLWCALDVPFE